jgi:nucleoside phosphorylase
METNLLKELLLKIYKLQSIMIDVATRRANLNDISASYTEIYEAVDLIIELLQEDGIPISNPNSFNTLRSWCTHCSNNLSTYALRRKCVCDLYIDTITFIENTLQRKALGISTNKVSTTFQPEWLIDFLSKIKQIQSILIAVATGSGDIDTQDADYIALYQDISLSIQSLQQAGLPLKNSNYFSSLWHWQSYWSSELEGYASREQFVTELYVNITKPVQKALQKHQQRLTSIEELTEDLQQRFSQQILEQPLALITVSNETAEQNVSTQANDLPARSLQVLEPDSTKSSISKVTTDILTVPMIDFAIITAIKVERLAILKAFEIDESRDRIRKGSRTYWRKRLLLPNGKFYEIVVAQLLDMVNVNAAILTNDILHHWNPSAVLMVGIAATAKPEPKQHLGNLVIGREIYYYETSKVTAEGKLPEPKYIPVDSTLLDRIQALPGSEFPILATRPDGTARPEMEVGVIASGDKVIADPAERDMIASANRKIMAIEMEGYGVISASWQSFDQVRCLVIRALCDYADSNKHDQWHAYAAAVAAGFTKHFLLDEPLDPRNSTEGANG